MKELLTRQQSQALKNGKNFAIDCGEELLGARKHLAAKFTPQWQEEIEKDPTQAYQLVCKDQFFEKFDPQQQKEDGLTSEVAYAIKLVWSRVAQRPKDDPLQRMLYMKALKILKERLDNATNEDLFDRCIRKIRAEYSSSPEFYEMWKSLGPRFKSLLTLSGSSRRTAWAQLRAKAFRSDEGANWNWTKKQPRTKAAPKWARVAPGTVIRKSALRSGIVYPQDLMEEYGFRGVQFGKWIKDDAGKFNVLACGNALADLSDFLSIPRCAVSFYGKLGIAFGARGRGAASAHFEPTSNIINLTKFSGGGCLAHEWAHALDSNLFAYYNQFKGGKPQYMFGNPLTAYLPENLSLAYRNLMKAIKVGYGFIKVSVPEKLKLTHLYPGYATILERVDNDVNKAIEKIAGQYAESDNSLEKIGLYFCYLLEIKKLDVPRTFVIPTRNTFYYLDASKRGGYWKRDQELFARAFEAWIEDELAVRNLTNSFLVTGTNSDPYPHLIEREIINQAFREWWGALSSLGILEDEKLWK